MMPVILVERYMRQGGLIFAAGRVCVRRKKNTKKSAPPKTHHEIQRSLATAPTSRLRATKRVPRVSPYSPASMDPEFVESGLVQLSQSAKTTNVTHTLTQTAGQTYFIEMLKNVCSVSTTDWWLKVNLASCMIRQTRSLGAPVLYSCLLYTSPSPRD